MQPPRAYFPVGAAVLQIRWMLPEERRGVFESWYDEVHLPEMLAVPGVLAARRFIRVMTGFSSPTDYGPVIIYQLRSADVADGEDLRAMTAAAPDARTLSAVGGLRHSRTVFRLLETAKSGTQRPVGNALLHVLMSVRPASQDLFDRWYESEHLPQMRAVPGVHDGSRYVVDTRLSDNGPPQGMRYLTVYELESTEVVATEDFRRTGVPSPARRELGDALTAHVQVLRPSASVLDPEPDLRS